MDATCKRLCCQRKEAPAAALKMFKSRNKERDLESSCSEICVCQSQDTALWMSLIKDGSFLIWSCNPKYMLSPHRLKAKLWLWLEHPRADGHIPGGGGPDTFPTCAISLGILWPRRAAKIHIGHNKIPAGESAYGSSLGPWKWIKKSKSEEPEG